MTTQLKEAGAPSILNLCKYQKAQIQVEAKQQVSCCSFYTSASKNTELCRSGHSRDLEGQSERSSSPSLTFLIGGLIFLSFIPSGRLRNFLTLLPAFRTKHCPFLYLPRKRLTRNVFRSSSTKQILNSWFHHFLAGCLSKLFKVSLPQFSYLQSDGDNSTYLGRSLVTCKALGKVPGT